MVVFVTHNYPRHAGDLPGAFLQPLAVTLRDRGHDVRVVAPADRGKGGREALDGIPVRRVRYATPARETLAYSGRMQEATRSPGGLLALLGLVRALRAGALAEARAAQGDVVLHAHWWIPAGLALPRRSASLITLHGTDGRLLHGGPGRWLGRRVLRHAKVVSAVSPELAAIAEQASGRLDIASHVQPMPITQTDRPLSRGGGGAVIIARLTPQKRIALALRAMADLARRGQPMPVTIIGDGVERDALQAAAESLPAQVAVQFTGTLPGSEVAQRLATADVLLMPARDEGLGLAAIEALIAGVPVVACSDGGGVVSAIRRHGGGIIAAPTPGALADGVLRAREELRVDARRAGEQWRRELEPAQVAERFEGWYREALGA